MTFHPAGLRITWSAWDWVERQPPISLVLLAAPKQFEYQATNRLILAASEEYGDSGKHKRVLQRHKPKCYHQL